MSDSALNVAQCSSRTRAVARRRAVAVAVASPPLRALVRSFCWSDYGWPSRRRQPWCIWWCEWWSYLLCLHHRPCRSHMRACYSSSPPPPPPHPASAILANTTTTTTARPELAYTLFPRKPIPPIVDGFIADSGTSTHIANDPKHFTDLTHLPPAKTINITTGGGNLQAYGRGTVVIPTRTVMLRLTGVVFAPDCPVNLMSIPRVNAAGGMYVSTKKYAAIYSPSGDVAATRARMHGCFVFEQPKSDDGVFDITTSATQPASLFAFATIPGNESTAVPAKVLHMRFAHAPHRVLCKVATYDCVENFGASLEELQAFPLQPCRSCLLASAARWHTPLRRNTPRSATICLRLPKC
eukprot:364789-Chlamydomonas_euryale.AAC.1